MLFNALRLLWETGIRIDELLSITFKDVWAMDEETALLRVRNPKTGYRVLTLRETAPYVYHQTQVLQENPELIDMQLFQVEKKMIMKALSLMGFTAHALRKLSAMRLQKRNPPYWVIPYILGHRVRPFADQERA